MFLKELIDFLAERDPAIVARIGFHDPHSYRGDYSELAFEPLENATVGEMLKSAKSALGKTYQGYKGGSYTMGEYTTVNLSQYGTTGEEIGPILLKYMVGEL